MTLTSGGRLGIGETAPSVPLQVAGNANISGDAVFGGDINLTGTLIGNIQGNVVGNVNGQFTGNINATTGISTFNNVSIVGVGTADDYQVDKLSVGGNYFSDGNRISCLLYTSPSPRDGRISRMPSSA